MKQLSAVFVAVTFLLNAMAPTLAYAASYLQGTQVNANTLIQDAYVAVTYYDHKDRQTLVKGWIDAIDETTFDIRFRALFGKETIAYDRVLSVVMSDEAPPREKQVNEVERFIREQEKREASQRAQEKGQATIQRLTQKTVTVMAGEQIDPSEIPKGHYAYIVYTTQGATGRALSQIADRDASHITLKYGEDPHIAYSAIDTLVVAKDLHALDSYRERGAEYNVRVRVYAPSIEKDQIVGKLLKMKLDTLVIQTEPERAKFWTLSLEDPKMKPNTYEVPVSSISKFDVSIGQYRNTDKGLKIGLSAGGAIVGITAIYVYREIKELDRNPSGGDDSIAYYALGVIAMVGCSAGTVVCLLSTLVGAATKSDKWVEVSPQRFNLSLAPTSAKGLRAALTFNFF